MSVPTPSGPDRPDPTLEDLPSLAAFGAALAAVDDRRLRRGTRVVRGATGVGALLGVVVALTTFTGAAAIALTAATGSPVPAFARGDDTGVFPVPGTSRIPAVRAADPDGGPQWGVRVGRASDGLVCIGVGQVQGGVLGVRGLDGRFRPTPEVGNDACGPAPSSTSPVVAMRGFSGPRTSTPAGASTAVYGSGGADLASVVVTTGDGRRRDAHVASDGTFVALVRGWPEGAAPTVTLRWSGGRERTVRLGPSDSVPDPSGTFAWTTEPVFAVHVPGHRSPLGCARAVASRYQLSGGAPTSGVVCVPPSGPAAVLDRLVGPGDVGPRTVLAVRLPKGGRATVRLAGRDLPTVRTLTAGSPRPTSRRHADGRRVVRAPDGGGGPRAAVAVLPAGTSAADVSVVVRVGARRTRITPSEGAGR